MLNRLRGIPCLLLFATVDQPGSTSTRVPKMAAMTCRFEPPRVAITMKSDNLTIGAGCNIERIGSAFQHALYFWRNINTVMFNRIGAVILLVSDMKRSTSFYRDVLGMELKVKSKDWTEFSKSGTVIALHPSKKKRFKKNNSMLVGFSVSDFDDVCNGLKKKKVRFYKKPKKEPFGNHTIIQDPDGHLISIVQMPQEDMSQVPYYHGFAPV